MSDHPSVLLPTERAVTTDGRYMFPVELVQGSSQAGWKNKRTENSAFTRCSFLQERIAATLEGGRRTGLSPSRCCVVVSFYNVKIVM